MTFRQGNFVAMQKDDVATKMFALLKGSKLEKLEAAADFLNEALGSQHNKSTISRRNSGDLSWPIHEVHLIEDFLGRYPVSIARAKEIAAAHEGVEPDLLGATATASKEHGEAVSASMQAFQSQDIVDLKRAHSEALENEEAAYRHRLAVEAALQQREASCIVPIKGQGS